VRGNANQKKKEGGKEMNKEYPYGWSNDWTQPIKEEKATLISFAARGRLAQSSSTCGCPHIKVAKSSVSDSENRARPNHPQRMAVGL